jgi:hypothetical protein
MALIQSSITGRSDFEPLAVTIPKACELSGFGPTSIWAFLKDGRLKAVRIPGVRRTLVSYGSLAQLLAPPNESLKAPPHNRRQRKKIPRAPNENPSK